jgi:hypothetical protein
VEHLAPRLKTDELSWAIAALAVAFLFSTSLPALVITGRPVPTLLVFLGGSLLLFLVSRALVRRSPSSTVRERRKRDRDLENGTSWQISGSAGRGGRG